MAIDYSVVQKTSSEPEEKLQMGYKSIMRVSQSDSQSVSQSVSQLVSQTVSQSDSQSVNQSQLVSQSVSQSYHGKMVPDDDMECFSYYPILVSQYTYRTIGY